MYIVIGSGRCAYEILSFLCIDNTPYLSTGPRPIYSFSDSYQTIEQLSSVSNICDYTFLVAIGNPLIRRREHQRFIDYGYKPGIYVHYSACVYSDLKPGSIVYPLAVVMPGCDLGQSLILNVSSYIGHDVSTGDFVSLNPGARIAGSAHLSHNILLGMNSSIRENISITSDIIVGMGSAVVKSLTSPGIYVGVPARPLLK